MRQVAEEVREVDALRFNDEALAALERGARGSPVAGTALELFNCSRSREECRFVCVCLCVFVIDARFRFLTIVWEFFAT